jgi:UTP--glucose-1-phosphate uridylyltransferase
VEKPAVDQAPSNLAVAGRYILTPDIFECIDKHPAAKLTNSSSPTPCSCSQAPPFLWAQAQGVRHVIGNKLDFVKTNILYAMNQ